jgi:orotidine-5'-phosphate decarboxylase
MSVEKLLERIRKTKNPSVIDLSITPDQIPASIGENIDTATAIESFGNLVLTSLKQIVPAVRFSYGHFACMGANGITVFYSLLQTAKSCGFYVLVDAVDASSVRLCQISADFFMNLPCDGIIVSGYGGSDFLQLYSERLKETKKSLFVTLRNANRSASQIQDLMTGSRLVHIAAADIVKRVGENFKTRSGYSQVGGVASATSADSIRTLRSKYPNIFLLVDGYDYSNANAKNCSYAFDKLGHGAIVCGCDCILSAWKDEPNLEPKDCIVMAAERMKRNINRYVSIL